MILATFIMEAVSTLSHKKEMGWGCRDCPKYTFKTVPSSGFYLSLKLHTCIRVHSKDMSTVEKHQR